MEMYQENLFELIRKEEVVIWAGAGFSIYAGFPSGKQLGHILYNNLTATEKKQTKLEMPIPELAEDFYRLKGNNRNQLIRILKETFLDKKSKSFKYHESISKIPHLKTIITTNYDNLFELAYKSKAQLILSSNDIPYLDKEKVHIYKVHGDLSFPNSIIITRSDYNNFFKIGSENDIYWSSIKEKISTKNVLFLGYNLEDSNTSVIFEKITEAFGHNRKEWFLVAPNLPQHKVNHLSKNSIHYINMTAEKLVDELICNLKENIIADFKKQYTSAETFRDFLFNFNLLPELKTNNSGFTLNAIKGTKKTIKGLVNLTIKTENDFGNKFEDFITGRTVGDFEIPEDKLVEASFSLEGVKILNSDVISRILVKSLPNIKTKISLRFNDGFEYSDIDVAVYSSTSVVKIDATLKTAKIILELAIEPMPKENVKFSYTHNDYCSSIKDEIEFYQLLEYLGEGKEFKIFPKSKPSFVKSFPKMEILVNEAKFYLDYFNKLKLIENYFEIYFESISAKSLNKGSDKIVRKLISIINNETITYNWDSEVSISLNAITKETINELEHINKSTSPILVELDDNELIELHGHEINIGNKQIQILNPYISNIEDVIKNHNTNAIIKSNDKKIMITYLGKREEYQPITRAKT